MGTIDIRVPKSHRRQQEQLRARQMARDIQRVQEKVSRPHQARPRFKGKDLVVTVWSDRETSEEIAFRLMKMGFIEPGSLTGSIRAALVRQQRIVLFPSNIHRSHKMNDAKPTRTAAPVTTVQDAGLVPNKDSDAYRQLEHAYEHGKRVSTKDMSEAEFLSMILGPKTVG